MMRGSDKKPRKSLTSLPQTCISVGFVAGALVVLLYLVVSQNFVQVPYVVITQAQRTTGEEQLISGDEKAEQSKVVCNSEGRFSESCEADGDVRINGTAMSVLVVSTSSRWSDQLEWEIRPYSRRNVHFIKKVTVRHLADRAAAPACTVTYNTPAVVFAIGGLSGGNYWHDYADVLVPLFIAAQRYGGEVQLLVTNAGEVPWWLGRYETLLKRLSKHDVVDLGGDAEVRCFSHVTVGLHMHKEFTIVPELDAGGGRLSMADFTRFQREIYALPRHVAVSLALEPGKKPRLMVIHRGKKRRQLLNLQEVVRAAEAAGFEAAALDLLPDMPVAEQARVVNSFDVLLGVHGAGLTSEVFLPPGAVVIQVVPYGKLDYMANLEFGDTATDMGLKYISYSASLEEGTLLEVLGPEHPAVTDPDAIHRSGWPNVYEFYLKQDLRINITRFAPSLAKAFDHLRGCASSS